MRAISLWQPWASLWASGRKVHETRHWYTDYRGLLAIHAAQKLIKDVDDDLNRILIDQFGPFWRSALPRGAIVGICILSACRYVGDQGEVPVAATPDDLVCGDYSPGRYGWEAQRPVLFKRPIPFKGQQGFFDIPDDVLRGAA